METWLIQILQNLPILLIFGIIILSILILGKSADLLVDEAVVLSLNWGVPKLIIGATIISLGTTLPEAAVSVLAAISGKPDIALGNAVGSIICDTGLILGIAILISPPKIDRSLVNRQGWIQFGSGILLVLSCLPYSNLSSIWEKGGNLPQFMGIIFVILLIFYIILSLRWIKKSELESELSEELDEKSKPSYSNLYSILKIIGAIAAIIISSKILIPSVEEVAIRLEIPKSIISATLVALGTSLPELATSITAARKGHGELALGNIIGADILNVLFVAGTSAAFTKGGLDADESFFIFFFPAMIFVLIVFRISIVFSKERISRIFGIVLLLSYLLVTVSSYFTKID